MCVICFKFVCFGAVWFVKGAVWFRLEWFAYFLRPYNVGGVRSCISEGLDTFGVDSKELFVCISSTKCVFGHGLLRLDFVWREIRFPVYSYIYI